MIAFRYTKTDGAEYLSHLDLLRHISRTFRRAGVCVRQSEGFHRHDRIFLNNPLPIGVKSVAEYGAADCDFEGDFKAVFNEFSPEGVKCLDARAAAQNPNYANCITACAYRAEGLNNFDCSKVLERENIIITDLRGRNTDIRPKIKELCFDGQALLFTLACGTENLRADLFCQYISSVFGGRAEKIIKTAAFGEGVF